MRRRIEVEDLLLGRETKFVLLMGGEGRRVR